MNMNLAAQLNLTVSTLKKVPIQHILTVCHVYSNRAAASSPEKQTVFCELWKGGGLMHLSIVCPTNPHTGKGGANRGFEVLFQSIFRPLGVHPKINSPHYWVELPRNISTHEQ